LLPALALAAPARAASSQRLEIAVALPFSGDEVSYGKVTSEGIQLAIEEANEDRVAPHIDLKTYDDRSLDEGAKDVAERIIKSDAMLVLGPTFSTASLAAGPVYASAGLVSLAPTATADTITRNVTTYRVIFKNSEQGETLATYLARVLNLRRAAVLVVDNGYGNSLREGFERAAARLGIEAKYYLFKTREEGQLLARRLGSDLSSPPIVFFMLDADAAAILTTLRRLDVAGPFLGADSLGDEIFSERFTNLPEERRQRGHFTDGVYAISPMILDSANADTLEFGARFRARFGHDPVWQSVTAYDAGRVAATAVRAVAAAADAKADLHELRIATLNYMLSLDDPAKALPGLLGPLWFDQDHGRQQAVRIGQFNHGRFESAPLQIIPVSKPDTGEINSSGVFEVAPGRYARLQRVVYTGMYINEIPRVDLTRLSFGADFYLWLRYARDAGQGSSDPTDINFPNMISGGFDRLQPAEQGEMSDGTVYRLWRIQGEFRNDFDLHRYPFDRQTLSLSFFNARAAADRIVYVLDNRTSVGERGAAAAAQSGGAMAAAPPAGAEAGAPHAVVSNAAFRNLTQWDPLGAAQRRENLLTDSALGDPRRVGAESYRELSGFLVSVDLKRRAVATLAKTLLPLMLMTFIMYASLYFPHGLVKEKVTVAITGALSGAVLLTAINSQLGGVGYTVAVEYVFYVFFGLCLLCIVAVLGAERLRTAGRAQTAVLTESWTRRVYLFTVVATLAGAAALL
jgi:ABC-type branched-subunit amino acid transport system substrate-binding protein